MKLVKSFLAAGLLAVCIQPQQLHAADSQAQSLARDALEKKLQELQPVTPPATAPAPAPTVTKKAPQPPAPVPSPQRPPAVVAAPAAAAVPVAAPPAAPVVVAPRPAESAAIARAREAVERKMNELDGKPVTAPASVPPTPVVMPPPVAVKPPVATPPAAPPPPPAAAAVVTAPAVVPSPPVANRPAGPVTPSVDSAKVAKAREVLRQKMNEMGPPTPVESVPPPLEPASMSSKKQDKTLKFPPIAGPPSPLSGEKQQRLAELLRRYQADELSPQQYHVERSKLMAEP